MPFKDIEEVISDKTERARISTKLYALLGTSQTIMNFEADDELSEDIDIEEGKFRVCYEKNQLLNKYKIISILKFQSEN